MYGSATTESFALHWSPRFWGKSANAILAKLELAAHLSRLEMASRFSTSKSRSRDTVAQPNGPLAIPPIGALRYPNAMIASSAMDLITLVTSGVFHVISPPHPFKGDTLPWPKFPTGGWSNGPISLTTKRGGVCVGDIFSARK